MKTYPDNYNWMAERFGKVMEAHQQFGHAMREAGPLTAREAHLIQLAGAAATRSEGAVHSHVKQALAAGAGPEEVYHALLLLASTIGFPAAAAALSWARDVVEKYNRG